MYDQVGQQVNIILADQKFFYPACLFLFCFCFLFFARRSDLHLATDGLQSLASFSFERTPSRPVRNAAYFSYHELFDKPYNNA